MKLPLLLCFASLLSVAAQAQTATAAISLSPAVLPFMATQGSNPGSNSIYVATGAAVPWTASASSAWLALSPASGTGTARITAAVDTSGMLPGLYSGMVRVKAGASTASLAVTLSIAARPDLPIVNGRAWYVSPAGTSHGDGSIDQPWDIVTGLNNKAVQPGDTVWLRGGRYGDGTKAAIITSSLVGSAAAPIIVRSLRNERVVIDAWLQAGCCDQANNPARGSYTWFWGLEFAGFNTNRISTASGDQANHAGADTWGDGTKFINCIAHDTAAGFSVWDTKNSELYGNIIYNIGGYGPDRGHGHDFYLQNSAPSYLAVADNIGFNNFDEGVQAYGSHTADVQNMTFTGNIIFNSGALNGTLVDNFTIGGSATGPAGIMLDGNYTYDTPSRNLGQNELGYLWTPVSNDAIVTNNYFIGGFQAVDLERWNSLTFQNNTMYVADGSQQSWLIYGTGQDPASYNYGHNTYYGPNQFWVFASCDNWPCPNGFQTVDSAHWQASVNLDTSSTFHAGAPTGLWTFVRPNLYEPGRANIVVYNWDMQGSVAVDLSGAGIKAGDPFEIRDAQNWFNGAVVSGTYTGAPVTVPLSGLQVAQPVGAVPSPPSHTGPQFGAFVLLSGSAYPKAPPATPPVRRRAP